nr:MAG TPA: hypothetical protein [Caudoviricetes sp.]
MFAVFVIVDLVSPRFTSFINASQFLTPLFVSNVCSYNFKINSLYTY